MRLPLAISLVVLLAAFVSVIYQSGRLPVPSQASRKAYTRLQTISRKPHPYNSYENDNIRRYLRDIISDECPSALDESDNSTFWAGQDTEQGLRTSTYHEQTNLVFYLPSSKIAVDTILLSAHYDSVSSSNGATDDGMGLTVLLALVRKYCQHSLPSNLIFNFNNAEEDGLFGARAFLSHARFSEIKSFINLEGAGAGGPAMLFRASGSRVAAAYKGASLPRSSILGNDFFKQRVIKSETDFVIYDPLVPGLDIAFFAPRSQYHTSRDSSKTTSANSIEHMLSAADHALVNLAHQGRGPVHDADRPLFFDFLGLRFFSFKLTSLLWFNLAILLASPIVLGVSFGIRSMIAKVKFVGIGRTFGALILQIGIVVGLSILIAGMNPYIIHSSPRLYSATILLASFTANMFSTRLFSSRIKDQHDLSRVMSWELMLIWYIFLIAATIFSLVKGLGSIYLVTLNFIATFAVAIVSLFERSAYIPPAETFDSIRAPRDADQESTESSPLLRRDPLSPEIEESIRRDKRTRDYRSGTTWLIKYLILVPVPLLVSLWLLYSTVLPGLSQTLPDGSSGTTLYAVVGLFAILAFFNLAPFFLSTSLASALPSLLLILILMSLTCVLKAPFDVKSPLKVMFKQVVDLDHPMSSNITIEGLPKYMETAVSSVALAQKGLHCTTGATKSPKLNTCTFPAPVDARLQKNGLSIKVQDRTKNSTVDKMLIIEPLNSRMCDIQFSRTVTIRSINKKQISGKESHFRVHRRDWSSPFQIGLDRDSDGVSGRVTCLWDDRTDDQIIEFDTVQAELPEWAELTKLETGLLHFSKSITL